MSASEQNKQDYITALQVMSEASENGFIDHLHDLAAIQVQARVYGTEALKDVSEEIITQLGEEAVQGASIMLISASSQVRSTIREANRIKAYEAEVVLAGENLREDEAIDNTVAEGAEMYLGELQRAKNMTRGTEIISEAFSHHQGLGDKHRQYKTGSEDSPSA